MHLNDHQGSTHHPHHQRVGRLDKNSNGQEVFLLLLLWLLLFGGKEGKTSM